MRRRYRRRTGSRHSATGHLLFGSAGWLFADLLLALAITFLLANTVAVALPTPPSPHPAKPHPVPVHKKPPRPGHPEAALDFHYIDVMVTNVDSYGAAAGQSSAIAPIIKAVADDRQLKGRSAGLVLLFDGDDGSGFPQWETLDMKVWGALREAIPRYSRWRSPGTSCRPAGHPAPLSCRSTYSSSHKAGSMIRTASPSRSSGANRRHDRGFIPSRLNGTSARARPAGIRLISLSPGLPGPAGRLSGRPYSTRAGRRSRYSESRISFARRPWPRTSYRKMIAGGWTSVPTPEVT